MTTQPDVSWEPTSSFRSLDGGTYGAIMVAVVDLGEQVTQFQDSKPAIKKQFRMLFEVPDELMEDGRPMVQWSPAINVAFGKRAKMVQWLKAWGHHGAGTVSITKLLGTPATVIVETYQDKEGTERSKIVGLSKPPKGLNAKPVNEPYAYKPGDGDPESATNWERVPEFLQRAIKGGIEDVAAFRAGKTEISESDIAF